MVKDKLVDDFAEAHYSNLKSLINHTAVICKLTQFSFQYVDLSSFELYLCLSHHQRQLNPQLSLQLIIIQ